MSDDKRLERIEDKVDSINDHVAKVQTTLAEQHISLKEHMRRTALLEAEIRPIKRHVNHVEGAMKLLAAAALLGALIEVVAKISGHG